MKAKSGLSLAIIVCTAACTALAQQYEAYFNYLGNHPHQVESFWSHEAQGITHDETHWYLTQDLHLWKVRAEYNLAASQPDPQGLHRQMRDYPELYNAGYNHFGDLTYFEFDGQGYLFIPLSDTGDGPCPALGVFEADTLNLIDYICVYSAPWAALDPAGRVYLGRSLDGFAYLDRFSIEWPALRDARQLSFTNEARITLRQPDGQPLPLSSMQGGVFSPSGDLLYMTTGFPGIGADPDPHGIHVFDTATWRRIRKSRTGTGCRPFCFDFDPTCCVFEEPEGLTIWDLDGGRAPGIDGQLHVVLLDNDDGIDDVYMKHYTLSISVNPAAGGTEEGTPSNPFHSVSDAIDYAWDGSAIRLRASTYPEMLTISKRVRLVADGGVARIGG